MHVSLEPKSSKSPCWTLQLSHASNGCPSVRGAHHKDHIEHAILGTKDQTNNGRIVSMVSMKQTCHVKRPSTRKFNPWKSEHFFQPKKFVALHKRGGGRPSHAWRYTTQIVGPGEVLAWSRTKWLWIHFSMTHLLHQHYTHVCPEILYISRSWINT